ncbi:MAG: DUF6089 family protein [Bacteroidota bacterium]|uniref:DUF6089 family protein n=1 Tax=Runella sp. TaxID=1960881 RepID=UPI003015FFA9
MRKITLLIICLYCYNTVSAQFLRQNRHFLDFGVLLGVANYSGDLAEPNIEWNQTRPAIGLYARYQISEVLYLKGQLNTGVIFGDDKNSDTRTFREFRFKGPLVELAAILEYAPFNFGFVTGNADELNFFPYVFAGVGGAFSKPNARYYGSTFPSPFVKTPFPEGNRSKHLFLSTPIGIGVHVNINARVTVGFETGWRPVYSDKLDGISINANPKENDWYYFGGVTVSYYFGIPWKISN